MAQSLATGSHDDQELFNDLATNWPDTWRKRFQLDTRQMCFGSAHRARDSYSFDSARGRWINSATGQAPLLMHFNGGGKDWMQEAVETGAGYGKPWSSQAEAELLLWGTSAVTSRPVRTSEICAGAPDNR